MKITALGAKKFLELCFSKSAENIQPKLQEDILDARINERDIAKNIAENHYSSLQGSKASHKCGYNPSEI